MLIQLLEFSAILGAIALTPRLVKIDLTAEGVELRDRLAEFGGMVIDHIKDLWDEYRNGENPFGQVARQGSLTDHIKHPWQKPSPRSKNSPIGSTGMADKPCYPMAKASGLVAALTDRATTDAADNFDTLATYQKRHINDLGQPLKFRNSVATTRYGTTSGQVAIHEIDADRDPDDALADRTAADDTNAFDTITAHPAPGSTITQRRIHTADDAEILDRG